MSCVFFVVLVAVFVEGLLLVWGPQVVSKDFY